MELIVAQYNKLIQWLEGIMDLIVLRNTKIYVTKLVNQWRRYHSVL